MALLVTVAVVAIVLPPTTAQAASGDVTFVGHGYGHGRGMGQWGALGYAVDYGWNAAQILDRYYGGTVPGNVGNPEMSVELLSLNGMPLVVTGPGLTVNGVGVGDSAVRLTLQPDGTIKGEKGAGCAPANWSPLGTFPANATRVRTTVAATSLDNLLRVCEAAGERAYRGELSVVNHNGTQMTINHLPTESYLRGVVPRESPAYWGALGGGRGTQALMAQAVAARSYALASTRPTGAHTCDTTACQVYGGAGFKTSSMTALEQPATDTAISATAGVVRLRGGSPVRTEFSSSTGGWTAGGDFPAVEDLGDSITSNPNHSWTTSFALSDIAAKLGTGTIRSIGVTARNGLGADGGRVTNVRVVTTAGVVRDFSGNQVRLALGLKSDWFSISGITSAAAEAVVRALYQDVLGRGPDPAGLALWTSAVLTTGNSRVVAQGIVYSRERMNTFVVAQYRSALLRDPEPAGLENWVRRLELSGGGVSDLQIGIYGSPESLQTLGGGDLHTWVGALYLGLLGRSSSGSERQYWVDQAALHGRASVVASIARSDEAGTRRLTAYYQTFLQRGVDPSGLGTFLPMMAEQGDFDVPVNLGSSPEYWNLAQSRTF